jgi:NhaC family Na+:H+ antiporter
MSAEELDRYQREEEEMSENKTVEVRKGANMSAKHA